MMLCPLTSVIVVSHSETDWMVVEKMVFGVEFGVGSM